MQDKIFKMIESLIDIAAFELEYRHRLENPFNEKWLNTTSTKVRIQNVRKFLYRSIILLIRTESAESFYDIALKQYFKYPLSIFIQEIKQSIAGKTVDPLYRLIYYKLNIQELFIIYTNVVSYEHQNFPYILQNLVAHEYTIKGNRIIDSNDIFKYYIHVLDVLSSSSIVSLFDLDALKSTIRSDKDFIDKKPLETLRIYTEWPKVEVEDFNQRFPNFELKIKQKMTETQDHKELLQFAEQNFN